jgi:arylsulfatase A-like enzyme
LPETSPDSGHARNLVVILIDTLRQDHLRTYGYPRETAPTLTRLASEGAVFDGLSPTSWTKPAVASLLTGLHPLRHQAVGMRDRLPAAAVSLAELLKARGYRTLAVTANGFSSARCGMDQGFDESVYLLDLGYGAFASSEDVDKEVFRRLGTLRAPFFLFVHYLDPHAPYDPPAWGDSWITRRGRKTIGIFDLEMDTFMSRPTAFLRDAIDTYDGEILRVDRSIDALLRRLDGLGLMQSTLSVVTSDHGEEFEEHGRMAHGQSLYQEVVRVPLIFHWPGSISSGSRHGTASLLDVFPTVMELLGADSAADSDGRSLAAEVREGRRYEPGDREFMLHLDVNDGHYLALQRGSQKLILGRYPRRKQLFDLAADPRESMNRLAGDRPPADFEGMAARLAAAYNGLAGQALLRVADVEAQEQTRAMAALGYVASRGSEERRIPPRIQPADDESGGLLGWEEPRSFKPCLDLAARAASPQLLEGWFEAEYGGRWTWPKATAVISLPQSRQRLRLRIAGVKRDPAPGRLTAVLDGELLLDQAVPTGTFALVAPIAQAPHPLARLRIERTPAYVPALMGGLDGRVALRPDHRTLGFFLTSLCVEENRLESAAATARSPAP